MDRRSVLKSFLACSGAIALVSFAYPLVRFLAPPGREGRTKKVTLGKAEVPPGEAKDIVFNNTPAIVINRPDKGFIALSKVCTHLGCLVEYERTRKRLLCPCHAGLYDLEGNVISGPPPKPLARLPLKIEGDRIEIG